MQSRKLFGMGNERQGGVRAGCVYRFVACHGGNAVSYLEEGPTVAIGVTNSVLSNYLKAAKPAWAILGGKGRERISKQRGKSKISSPKVRKTHPCLIAPVLSPHYANLMS